MEMNQGENPLQSEEKKELKEVPYSDKEKDYASYLQTRLQLARDQRNQNHDEFDGMTYLQYYESNLKGANSFIAPKKNKEDTTFVTGTTRQAILALLAKINMLNLSPEVKAYDKNNHQDIQVGQAMEDIIYKADQLDNDELKKILRQYEEFVQGTVFVEEVWAEEFRAEKDMNTKDWSGAVKGVEWKERLKKVFEGCRRNLIPGPNVFLGNITEFEMEQQPFVFTVDYVDYDEVKAQYGEWERWKYVTRDLQPFSTDRPQAIYFNNWRLQTTRKNMVEVIKYQDKWANEYMVILNGVMMMPAGFPLPWKYGEYNLVKGVDEIITPYFAYGGSKVKKLKSAQALEDEFWRLALLKTQKSFLPPIGNMTGKIISSRVFMPGKITQGINADMLKPLGETTGVTTSEVQMLNMLKENLQNNSLPDISQAQSPNGDPTATEILQLQREAKVMLGLAVVSATLLEQKLGYLRLYNILENWFEPEGTEADEIRQEIKKKYRSVSRPATIEGAGKGRRMVKLADQLPQQEEFPGQDDIYTEEEDLSASEGQPVRITYLNPKELQSVKYTWHVEVNPREKESSELSKVLFNTMLQGLQLIGETAQINPRVNLDFIDEKFAEAWDLPADKAFTQQAQAVLGGGQMPMPAGQPGQPVPSQMQAGIKAPLNAGRPSVNTLVNGQ
jgi:hypothetical protein